MACVVAGCALVASGCAGLSGLHGPASPASSSDTTPAAGASLERVTAADLRDAEHVVGSYVDAVRSRDTSAAAALLTSKFRTEVITKLWPSEKARWRGQKVRSFSHPGRYLANERLLARRYAWQSGHLPYKLAVLNLTSSAEGSSTLSDIDFVVTKADEAAPWLIADFADEASQ